MDIVFSIGFPLLFFVISYLISDSRISDKKEKSGERRKLLNDLVIIFSEEAGFFLFLTIIIRAFMFRDKNSLPPIAVLFASALPFAAFLMRRLTKHSRTALFLKRSAAAVLAIFTAEIIVFNFKSFDKKPQSTYIDLSSVTTQDGSEFSGEDIVISGNSTLTFEKLPDYTRALIVEQEREIPENKYISPFMVLIGVNDDNASTYFETMRQRMISSEESSFAMSFTPYKNIHGVILSFSDIGTPIKIHSIRAVSSVPFSFSYIRFFILSGIALIICMVLSYSLWKVTYQRRKLSHRLAVGGMVLLCMLSTTMFIRPHEKAYKFDTQNVSGDDPYAATLDAFNKGQLYLDIEPSQELMDMDDPYDRPARDEQGVPYIWDMAYYKGHYYSYFGVAPVLLFYAPYYKLTGKMPTTGMAQPIFGLLAVFSICMTILAAVKRYVPRPNLLLLLGLMPASICVSGIFYALNYSNKYVLPTICGLAFLFTTLWTGLSACSCKRKKLRIALLFFSGLSLSLCTASRPSFAFSSVVLIPLFIGILRNKGFRLSYRLAQAAAFTVPLFIGGCAIMWYNNARFGSPFDFGAAYQLTVSNVNANHLHIAGFAPMLYHFVFLRPRVRGFFPFFEPNYCNIYNYGRSVYASESVGILTYPLFALGAAMLPAALRRRRRNSALSSRNRARNKFIAVCLIVPFIIGWQSYCLGGVNQRYVFDMTPLLIIGAAVCILRGNASASKNSLRYIISHSCLAATFIVWGLMAATDRSGNLIAHYPAINDICEDLLIFWL